MIPGKVLCCTTHHHACECREYRMREMETALKCIAVWAELPDPVCPDATFGMIKKRAMDALNCLAGLRD